MNLVTVTEPITKTITVSEHKCLLFRGEIFFFVGFVCLEQTFDFFLSHTPHTLMDKQSDELVSKRKEENILTYTQTFENENGKKKEKIISNNSNDVNPAYTS